MMMISMDLEILYILSLTIACQWIRNSHKNIPETYLLFLNKHLVSLGPGVSLVIISQFPRGPRTSAGITK